MISQVRRDIRRVVLVNPPMRIEQVYGIFSPWGGASPPTGMCYIAAVLREQGFDVSILDAEALGLDCGETVSRILAKDPQIVGLACKTLWVENAHRVARELKARAPDVMVVAGGNHVTALPERSLQAFPAFDLVVVGEGEKTFLELATALNDGRDLKSVPGLALRENGGAARTPPRERIRNLDELPFPAFDLLPDLATHYRPALTSVEKLPAFSVVASRGCPCHCTFCDRGVFGNRVTTHSPEYTVALLRTLVDTYGIRYLLFDDDNLLLNRKRLFRLLDLMKDQELRLPFTCQSRVDTVDEERLRCLKEAGCRMVLFGIESGSQRILDAMKKGITVDQIRKAIALTHEFRIRAQGFFILGYPGETEETMQETVQMIRDCRFDDVGVFLFSPLPGSEAYRDIVAQGTFAEDWSRMNSLDEVVFVPEGLTAEKLREYSDRCYRACYAGARQALSLFKRCTSLAHLRALASSVPQLLKGG